MARIGKIARLPRHIRNELNQRLDNGEIGPQLLAWLNGLPEVQTRLNEMFGGRPINPTNLSDWRQGGYADWQTEELAVRLAREQADETLQRLKREAEAAKASPTPGPTGSPEERLKLLLGLMEKFEGLIQAGSGPGAKKPR